MKIIANFLNRFLAKHSKIEEKYITQLLTKEEVNEGANMNDIGVKD